MCLFNIIDEIFLLLIFRILTVLQERQEMSNRNLLILTSFEVGKLLYYNCIPSYLYSRVHRLFNFSVPSWLTRFNVFQSQASSRLVCSAEERSSSSLFLSILLQMVCKKSRILFETNITASLFTKIVMFHATFDGNIVSQF